jgi:hypothetical protein
VPPAIPRVIFVKGDHWYDDSGQPDPSQERGIAASIDMLQGSIHWPALSRRRARALRDTVGLAGAGPDLGRPSRDTSRQDGARRRTRTRAAKFREPVHRRQQPHRDESAPPADCRDHKLQIPQCRDCRRCQRCRRALHRIVPCGLSDGDSLQSRRRIASFTVKCAALRPVQGRYRGSSRRERHRRPRQSMSGIAVRQ